MKMLFAFLCFFICSIAFSQHNNYPDFSWDKVPVAFHFGKRGRLLTKKEAKFVASKSNFICLEKAHANVQFQHTEDAIEHEAKQLKKYNPNMKVIFYWNTFLDYPMFKAHDEYQKHPEWWLKTTTGALDLKNANIKRYDLSNPEVRDWWTEVAKKAVVNGSCDGVFMDAFAQVKAARNKKIWGIDKYNAVQQGLHDIIIETREKLGADKLIVYNGIRSTPQYQLGNAYQNETDAVMIEHFGHFNSTTKESMLKDIQEMVKSGKAGSIVVFKGWPGFDWLDKEIMAKPLKVKQKIARENITFPLASFLVGAQNNCYFIYNWGYRMEMGCLDWYPEFEKPLGKPLNAMKINGWELTRNYEYASVWVNLETKEAKINWK
ncbi:putative glycoside hydrolase family 15 protein [Tamlana agarivorans]|uniref:Glycoside hydrolase family 15 protein n=1 Tax=Pseudotamlana agarivorans TaxID=481183 RepID=A0ACC5U9D0_9FLAO|nr:putative glycoside hydrolase [Tamlana agarivorans]MBU2950938.1 putative glycoside hydrolase family 15 protein [Tamlana agarivorans]